MTSVKLLVEEFAFKAKLETERAPATCQAFLAHLPFECNFIHVRWSGEGIWTPLGDRTLVDELENPTSHPAPGQMLLYPGGISEPELILAYGGVQFSSKVGQLPGTHFLSIIEGTEHLFELGNRILWEGAKKMKIELVDFR